MVPGKWETSFQDWDGFIFRIPKKKSWWEQGIYATVSPPPYRVGSTYFDDALYDFSADDGRSLCHRLYGIDRDGGKPVGLANFRCIFGGIRRLQGSVSSFSLSFIPRLSNAKAYLLARNARRHPHDFLFVNTNFRFEFLNRTNFIKYCWQKKLHKEP